MGTYLSTPVKDKNTESGSCLDCPSQPCAWGVVDMQGWRKTMEDAHIAETNAELPIIVQQEEEQQPSQVRDGALASGRNSSGGAMAAAKIFGVFDGHGGPEVARFCQLYLCSVLSQHPKWRLTTKPTAQKQQNVTAAAANESSDDSDPKAIEEEGLDDPDPAESDIGLALRETFHALDRMIDDPERREEIIELRVIKPPPSERRGVDLNAIPKPRQSKSEGSLTTSAATDCISENDGDSARSNNGAAQQQHHQQNEGFKEGPVETQSSSGQQQQQKREDSASDSDTGNENQGDDKVALGVANIAAVADRAAEKEDDSDADSDDATGHDEAAKEREEEGTDEESSSPPSPSHQGIKAATVGAAGKVSGMFQRLLNLSPSQRERGVVVADLAGTNDDDKEKNVLGAAGSGRPPPPPPLMPSTLTPRVGSSAAAAAVAESDSPPPPTIVRNGRLVCNLPDHAIHAGATAIVAVLVEHTLTVANAGDSRAVLCRDGTAFPLSYDHKPMSEIEHTRIQEAGGFVNQFGRVNGNLNLSRSIGDLKYKQDRGIAPAAQMITAEPDILQVTIKETDEFILLGCDGIWDCLTNEQAVQYVRTRLDQRTPSQIGIEMLDEILSEDPRATQGIGGDNMTIMIVDLHPHKRNYRRTPPADVLPSPT